MGPAHDCCLGSSGAEIFVDELINAKIEDEPFRGSPVNAVRTVESWSITNKVLEDSIIFILVARLQAAPNGLVGPWLGYRVYANCEHARRF